MNNGYDHMLSLISISINGEFKNNKLSKEALHTHTHVYKVLLSYFICVTYSKLKGSYSITTPPFDSHTIIS